MVVHAQELFTTSQRQKKPVSCGEENVFRRARLINSLLTESNKIANFTVRLYTLYGSLVSRIVYFISGARALWERYFVSVVLRFVCLVAYNSGACSSKRTAASQKKKKSCRNNINYTRFYSIYQKTGNDSVSFEMMKANFYLQSITFH